MLPAGVYVPTILITTDINIGCLLITLTPLKTPCEISYGHNLVLHRAVNKVNEVMKP